MCLTLIFMSGCSRHKTNIKGWDLIWSDEFDGKNIAVYTDNHSGEKYHKYFESVRPMRSELGRGEVKILLGKNFNYDLYKTEIINEIKSKYYTLPDYLPYGQCYFDKKYFLDDKK